MAVEGPDETVVEVTVVKPFASYFTGERAFFLPDAAQALVDEGLATMGGAGPSTDPPTVVAIPQIAQVADTLHCTMGEWTGSPTAYAYQWQLNGTDAGPDDPNFTVTPAEAGQTAVCIVTATNAAGSATAPPSNSVIVA